MAIIHEMMERMAPKHKLHISLYGNNRRDSLVTMKLQTRKYFSYGCGNRAAWVRIPTSTAAEKKGYIEDRRPASDIDPYVVGAAIIDTTLLNESLLLTINWPLYDIGRNGSKTAQIEDVWRYDSISSLEIQIY